jgi:hypothetical protein
MKYKSFWKSEFEKLLSSISATNNLRFWEEVSENIQESEIKIWEYVYKFGLKNTSVNILIFSSIDKITDRSRAVGSDAIRVIFEWNTVNGKIYSKIAKRNRVEGTFHNVKATLLNSSEKCFKLDGSKFGTIENALT